MLARVEHNELDTGPKSAGAERMCAVTRETKPVAEMIRFVLGPDGGPVPDLKRRLPGRGIWVTGTRASVAEAVRRNVFAKSFKREVLATPDLVGQTEALLARAALDALAIAGKAGHIVSGFAKVDAAIASERLMAVLHARNAAPDGVRKLNSALRQRDDAKHIAIVDGFTSDQLDLALGRTNVVHAALLAGPESRGFLARYARWERFRTT
jgi:predicted RNA-binding protein YlxR (DUF448 family)